MPKIQNLYNFVQILASQLVPKFKTSSKERPTKRPRKPPTETSKSGISWTSFSVVPVIQNVLAFILTVVPLTPGAFISVSST